MANGNVRQIVQPPTPMKITQIAVVVRDIEAALKTYTQTLGWGSGRRRRLHAGRPVHRRARQSR